MPSTRREVNCALLPFLYISGNVGRTESTSDELRLDQTANSMNREALKKLSMRTSTGEGITFFVDPNSQASKWLKMNSDSPDVVYMQKIATNMRSVWFGKWSGDIFQASTRMLEQHAAQGALPVFVLYNIPARDNGSYSSGGAGSPDAYYQWIDQLGSAIGSKKTIVILEPDSLALAPEIAEQENRSMRYNLINNAIDILQRRSKAMVYIDGGHPNWHSPIDMVSLLQQGGIDKASGFSVNVSNFIETPKCLEYGRAISARTGGAHFVIDTSRNGRGTPADPGEYCNPNGAALGDSPTTETGEALCDAFLWVKVPGESDGPCNGGPAAGQFWPEYAIALARNANA